MKISTARYANRNVPSHGIPCQASRGCPKWPLGYTIQAQVLEIAPPGYLLNVEEPEEFARRYRKHLDEVGLNTIARAIGKAAWSPEEGFKDVVLLCYEDLRTDPGCHRRVFAEWWQEKTGEVVEEVPEAAPPRTVKPPKPPDPQLQLFAPMDRND